MYLDEYALLTKKYDSLKLVVLYQGCNKKSYHLI